ncbi:amino acid permease, partial [Mycoplasmopsis alligatoris]
KDGNNVEQSLLGLTDLPKSKKINFFTGILIVIGSSMGAGIFFKSQSVLESNNYSLFLAIFSWIIASLAIVLMGISLLDISAKNKGNLSIVGWNHRFNTWMTYQMSKNFTLYINITLTYFFMPLYAIMSFQDGARIFGFYNFNTQADWAIWTIIILVISAYFIVTSGLKAKLATIQNAITLGFKIFALVATIIVGFSIFIIEVKNGNKLDIHWFKKIEISDPTKPMSFSNIMPFGGLFISWAGIFFAYDGFYVSTGISNELKDPKKTPKALLIGLSVVTIIHLIVALAMSLNGRGDFKEYSNFLSKNNLAWIYGLINLSIGIGVIGIINGFSLWIPRFIEELIQMHDVPFYKKLVKKTNQSYPVVGVVYSLVLILPIVLIFCILGATLYYPKEDPSGYYQLYGSGMSSLYNFADLMSNWISLLVFAFMAIAFFGAILESRRTPKKFSKRFKVVNIIVTLFLFVVVFVNFLYPIVDLILIISQKNTLQEEIYQIAFRGRLLSFLTLILFLAIIILPPVFINVFKKKRSKIIKNNQ